MSMVAANTKAFLTKASLVALAFASLTASISAEAGTVRRAANLNPVETGSPQYCNPNDRLPVAALKVARQEVNKFLIARGHRDVSVHRVTFKMVGSEKIQGYAKDSARTIVYIDALFELTDGTTLTTQGAKYDRFSVTMKQVPGQRCEVTRISAINIDDGNRTLDSFPYYNQFFPGLRLNSSLKAGERREATLKLDNPAYGAIESQHCNSQGECTAVETSQWDW